MKTDVADSRYRMVQIISFLLILLLCGAGVHAQTTQRQYPGRGAISAQDLGKIVRPEAAGNTSADQVCLRYTTGSTVADPVVLQSQGGVLTVTMSFNTVTDSQGLVRYCYVTNSGLEAPTLVVNPGDQLIIHFTNNLPVPAGLTPNVNPCDGMMGPNVTNIHFHGTDISPTCGQDEVLRTLVNPGQSFDYNVTIPADEPPGLYWYHPHPHGISEGQVQGGGTGALIIQGIQNVYPALAGMPERTLIIRDQNLPSSEANDSSIPAWDLSLNYVPVTYPSYTPAVIQTVPSERELWRVVNSAADTILDLQYVVNGTAQPMQVYSIDGYPLSSGSATAMTTVQLGPGARAEVVVTTPNVGDTAQLITQYQNTGPDGDYDPMRPIANVVSSTSATPPAQVPAQTAGTVNRSLFTSLTGLTPVANRNLYFSEVLENPADPNSPTNFYITEKGHTPTLFYMGQPPNIVVHAGTVEDWTVENQAGEDHVFHIHQLHFQVMAVDGVAVNDPSLHDTYNIPFWSGSGAYHSITVRMDFSDPNLVGTFVYHCHILEHEDAGMMGEIQVLPIGSGAIAAVGTSASSITPNQSVTLSATVTDATTGKPTPTGQVQFQLNGDNVGNPVTINSGQATLFTAVNGNVGANSLTALYEGDAAYDTTTSASTPIRISDFALTSAGATAAVGSAAIATVNVNVANDYTNLINLSCMMPSTLAEAACFVDPGSVTGTGTVQVTVNTTPAHPNSTAITSRSRWMFAGGGVSLAGMFLLFLPQWRRKRTVIVALGLFAAAFWVVGCSSGPAKTDPGTVAGTYMVLVTGTAGSGSSQVQVSVNVPITIH
jgi:FtsP/CotA-like multicopper oxidase with cupredoxin domain